MTATRFVLFVIVLALSAGLMLEDRSDARPNAPGEGACGIFVSASFGADTTVAGLSSDDPVSTINHGIIRAVDEGLSCVFVQAGTYNEVVELADGINLIGGYGVDWQYDLHDQPGHATTIVGGQHGPTGEYLALYAANLTTPVVVRNIIFDGPNAAGHINGSGRSAYGVVLDGCIDISFDHVSIAAGNGVPGVDGTDGEYVGFSSSLHGSYGGNAVYGASGCDSSPGAPGGSRGINPDKWQLNGGSGGSGGREDTSCSFPPNYAATSGWAGSAAATNPAGGWGNGGSGGSVCGYGGSAGWGLAGQHGVAGTGGSAVGTVASGFWYASAGTEGTLGTDGTGGGGGGGSGGCDDGAADCFGAGGGGGGAGGRASEWAGEGGGGGGSSIGIFASNSAFRVTDSSITTNNAGDGGEGGDAGRGQPGGSGGNGGSGAGGCETGGSGGDGGDAGHSGAGGGGSGGHSFGIYLHSSTLDSIGSSFAIGTAGAAGLGGGVSFGIPVNLAGGNGAPGNSGQIGATANSGTPPSLTGNEPVVCDAAPCTPPQVVVPYFSQADLWKIDVATFEARAFDEFFPGIANGGGCLLPDPLAPAVLNLAGGTMTVSLHDGIGPACSISDGSTTPAVSDAPMPDNNATLSLEFDPPVSAFYTYIGSLQVGQTMTMTLYGDDGTTVVQSFASPPSSDNVLAAGFGFVSNEPVGRIDLVSTESGGSVMGAFVGLKPSEPSLGTIDLGAYAGPGGSGVIELDFACRFETCPADTDGSNIVDVTDLLAVLAAWGNCPEPCPPSCDADVNDDCIVDVQDLLALLAAWGPCQ